MPLVISSPVFCDVKAWVEKTKMSFLIGELHRLFHNAKLDI